MIQILSTTICLNNKPIENDYNMHVIKEEWYDDYKQLAIRDAKKKYKDKIDALVKEGRSANISVEMTTREVPSTITMEKTSKEMIFRS